MMIRRLVPFIILSLLIAAFFQIGCDTLVTENNTIIVYDSSIAVACFDCHSDDDNLLLRPKGQFQNSAHANHAYLDATVDINGSLFEVNLCGSECHTHEGYLRTFDSVAISGTKYSAINCFTCHLPHTGEYAQYDVDSLRGLVPYISFYNQDMPAKDFGKSNSCANCHKIYDDYLFSEFSGSTVNLSALFGAHYSGQADLLAGTGGFQFWDTSLAETTYANSHLTSDACLKCHYEFGQGYTFGEHTFRLEDTLTGQQFPNSCNESPSCHDGTPPPVDNFYVGDIMNSIGMCLLGLQQRLESRRFLDPDDPEGNSFVVDTTIPVDAAKILYNYLFIMNEGSQGVHNPKYARELLYASIIKFDSLPPIGDFFADITSSCDTTDILFTDNSIGNRSFWKWNFGDGTIVDSVITDTISHTYEDRGIYEVTMIVKGIGFPDTVTIADYIVIDTTPVASFAVDHETACVGDTVGFTSLYTHFITPNFLWDFGDSTTSIFENPSHVYDTAGTYTVSLRVSNDCGIDLTTAVDVITILPLPVADFTTSINGLEVTFTDASIGGTINSWDWDFGDGETSTVQNPVHTYVTDTSVTYTVRLIVTNEDCTSLEKVHYVDFVF